MLPLRDLGERRGGNELGPARAVLGMNVEVDTLASPLLAVRGAVPAPAPDAGTAWHYGDPLREQRLLAAGSAVVDLSHRGVVRVTGPDRLSWLHSLTSQHLSALAPGVSTEALVLSPHGHVEHALHVIDDGESAWLTVEPGTAPQLVAWLDRMRFLLRVEVTDVSAQWAVLGLVVAEGGAAPAVLATEDAPPAWQDPWPRLAPGSASYSDSDAADGAAGRGPGGGGDPGAGPGSGGHPGGERPWRELLVARSELAERVSGVDLAGSWAAEALRVAAWRPRLGAETDHRTIPHELDWLRTAVHLTKGCYRGQETVARVHNLGRPPRRLVMLHLDGSEHTLPEHRDPVRWDGRAVGHVTTAARHHELGPVALALVKRSVPAGATLTVAGLSAAQEIIVRP